MAELVLTIIGRDRQGIVSALAQDVAFHGGNWERSELAEIAGTFAGVVVVSVPEGRIDELLASLMIMREQGVHVTAQMIEEPSQPAAQEIRLRLTGEDKPGVVHEITTAVTESGASISRMGTVTDIIGDDDVRQFEFTARLALPVDVRPYGVLDAIEARAAKLGVDVHVDDITGEPDAD